MKKILYLIMVAFLFASCESKLDITPKGQTILESTSDLETLLNQNWNLGICSDLAQISGEAYSFFSNVPSMLELTNTLEYAYITGDESVNRSELTNVDDRYTTIYKYVNYLNIIIDRIDDAKGDENKKPQIKAEAHIMRAYFHWIAVNLFAAQYDEATAAENGGIAYVKDLDVTKVKEKLSIAEVYENLLEDCSDEYIANLPDKSPNVVRGGKAWGNAVRAKILMQMKRYSEALPYALKAIEYHPNIDDRSYMEEGGDWNLPRTASNNLIYVAWMVSPFGEVISVETVKKFESGDYLKDHGGDEFGPIWDDSAGYMFGGVMGSSMYYGFGSCVNNFGITTDRMYYTAAECYIRTNQIDKGLEMVDKIREKRIDAEHYAPFKGTVSAEKEAMALLQRAKWIECIATYENFFDCKRWNTEANYKKDIVKNIPDIGTYTVKADSPLWIFPFPKNVRNYNPTLTNNY